MVILMLMETLVKFDVYEVFQFTCCLFYLLAGDMLKLFRDLCLCELKEISLW